MRSPSLYFKDPYTNHNPSRSLAIHVIIRADNQSLFTRASTHNIDTGAISTTLAILTYF